MKKQLIILGSTGSIGRQALDVIGRFSDDFNIRALSAHSNVAMLLDQAVAFGVHEVCITDESVAEDNHSLFREKGIKLRSGTEGIAGLMENSGSALLLNAIVGSAGLRATYEALRSDKAIALANKESIVAGGDLLRKVSGRRALACSSFIPVDSEHSAVFQCMEGHSLNSVRRIVLTASGGPFREAGRDKMINASLSDVLSHPTWNMGVKVTVDSATLMNKGLEVIEAHYLFNVPYEAIEVVVHPQSVIHGMVEFTDGSFLAQMSAPDMRLPISYALYYPKRTGETVIGTDFTKITKLEFEEPRIEDFPCLKMAYEAGRDGCGYPCAMNAANEAAVSAFVEGKIRFTEIEEVVKNALYEHETVNIENIEEVEEIERKSHINAKRFIDSISQ